MTGIVFDQNVVFRHWLYQRLEVPFLGYDVQTIAMVNADRIVAVVGYYNFTEHNCFMACAGNGFWLRPHVIKVLFKYPFVQLNKTRVTAFVNEHNLKSISMQRKLGFKEEGRIRCYYGTSDALVFGMTETECLYLRGEKWV